MQHFIYYPFREGTHLGPITGKNSANAQTLKRYTSKYSTKTRNKYGQSAAKTIFKPDPMPARKDGPLAGVEDNDLVLILGHGSQYESRDEITNEQKDDQKARVTANDLATQLYDCGLPTSHVLIKMLSCYGAGTVLVDGGIQKGTTGNEFFACLLAKALKQKRYSNIIVGGYAGAVSSNRPAQTPGSARSLEKSVSVQGDGGRYVAHGYILWYDGDGNEVPRTRITAIKGN